MSDLTYLTGSDFKMIKQSLDPLDLNYYGFAGNILTFGFSKKNSRPAILDLMECKWFLRVEKTTATLIHWDGKMDMKVFEKGATFLIKHGIKKIKSLPSVNPTFELNMPTTGVKVWFSDTNWRENPVLSSKYRKNIRRRLKHFTFEKIEKHSSSVWIMQDLFRRWLREAKKRRFMVTKGHYLKFIEWYPYLNDAHAIYAIHNGERIGMIGGFLDKNKAVIMLAKHDYSHNYTPSVMWHQYLEILHKDKGIPIVNCGDTCDKQKKMFGLSPTRATKFGWTDLRGLVGKPLSEVFK